MLTQIIEEASRWKREVAAGNLSPESIERLKKEGVAKTPEQYAAGLRRGSENIIKKAGFKLDTSPADVTKNTEDSKFLLGTGGAYADMLKKVVRAPDQIKGKINTDYDINNPLERELVLRHEANEAKYSNNLRKNSFLDTPLPRAQFEVNGRKGVHASFNVIADEAKDLNFYNNLFGVGQKMKDLRNSTENVILKNKLGIDYNQINFDNIKQVKRQINKFENKYVEPERLQKEYQLSQIANGKAEKPNNLNDILGNYKAYDLNRPLPNYKSTSNYNSNKKIEKPQTDTLNQILNRDENPLPYYILGGAELLGLYHLLH